MPWSRELPEPTFLEAIARIRSELAGVGALIAALGIGGSWLGVGEVQEADSLAQEAEVEARAAERVSAELVKFYAPELGLARLEIVRLQGKNEAQKDLCVGLLKAERENTAQWRAQCGGP